MANTIVREGMGGFLNPPNDAEHTWSVKSTGKDGEGNCSLRYALTCSWFSDGLKDAVRTILESNPPQFTPEWEQQVYAYFRNCYSPDGEERNVSKLLIAKDGEEFAADRHAGYLHIKTFFPEYTPNLELIRNPGSWGKVA